MCAAALKTEGWGRNPVSTDKKREKLCFLPPREEILKIESQISFIDMPWCYE
jgi:hypothetical protein